jgi:hypothetical protein
MSTSVHWASVVGDGDLARYDGGDGGSAVLFLRRVLRVIPI